MRAKAISIVTSAIVAGPALATPATAVEYAGPTITSPTAGQTVTGTYTVTADSEAPFVRFVVYDRTYYTPNQISAQVPVIDGTATYEWQTVGFLHPRLAVADCTSDAASDCARPGDPVAVDVTPPTDTIDAPTGEIFTNPDEDEPIAVTVAESDNPGSVNVAWHLGARSYVGHWPVTPGTPTEIAVDDYRGAYNTGTLLVERCHPLNDEICTPTSASGPALTLRRELQPKILNSEPYWLSPDGNGHGDVATVEARFDQIDEQSATWTLNDSSGESLMAEPQPITIAPNADGATTFDVDPHALGLSLESGDYTLQVDVTGTDHGHEFTGQDTWRLRVDSVSPHVNSLTRTFARFYPATDGYRDEVELFPNVSDGSIHTSSPQIDSVVEVLDSEGHVVRDIHAPSLDRGASFVWDGLTDTGEMAPAGTYRFRLTLGDEAGNRDVFVGGAVDLSPKRLVTKTWTRTVRARSSLVLDDSGRCSKLRTPGVHRWRGSLGYLSQARCKGRTRASRMAVGIHGVRVPKALRYHALFISAYGGSSRPRTGHRAGLLYLGKDSVLGRTQPLQPRVRWHGAGHRAARRMVTSDRAVFWAVTTAYGQRYDVGRFRIRLRYTVLR